MQLSEAAYGWRGALAMGMLGGTDSGASALSGVLGSVMSGDKAAFAHRAGVQVDSILYRSVDSELQEPHHWLVVDHERRELVLSTWTTSASLPAAHLHRTLTTRRLTQHAVAPSTLMMPSWTSQPLPCRSCAARPMKAWLLQHTSCTLLASRGTA